MAAIISFGRYLPGKILGNARTGGKTLVAHPSGFCRRAASKNGELLKPKRRLLIWESRRRGTAWRGPKPKCKW